MLLVNPINKIRKELDFTNVRTRRVNCYYVNIPIVTRQGEFIVSLVGTFCKQIFLLKNNTHTHKTENETYS